MVYALVAAASNRLFDCVPFYAGRGFVYTVLRHFLLVVNRPYHFVGGVIVFRHYAGHEGRFVAGDYDRWYESVAQDVRAVLVIDREVPFVSRDDSRYARFDFFNFVFRVGAYRGLMLRPGVPFTRLRVDSRSENRSPTNLITIWVSAGRFRTAVDEGVAIYYYDRGSFVPANGVVRASANGRAWPVVGLVQRPRLRAVGGLTSVRYAVSEVRVKDSLAAQGDVSLSRRR